MRVSWSTADSNHQMALLAAFTQLGTKYRRNASTPGVAFDCSGLTSWAWGQAGTQLFRQSRTQIRSSEPVTRETAQAGDLVYYPGHVMMWLGVGSANAVCLHARQTTSLIFLARAMSLVLTDFVPRSVDEARSVPPGVSTRGSIQYLRRLESTPTDSRRYGYRFGY